MTLHAISLFLTSKALPIALALLGFGILVAVHEFGHFIFCKLFGIHTPTFSIGFGPELYRRKLGRTDFRLALIPFGGYCEIAGLAEVGQGEQEFATATGDDSFATKPYWQKLFVLGGGIILNLLFAYLVFCCLFMVGTNGPKGVVIDHVLKESAAQKAGIIRGDTILQINDKKLLDANGDVVENAQDILLTQIKDAPNAQASFIIKRKDKTLTLPVLLGSRTEGDKTVGSLGAQFQFLMPLKALPFFAAIKRGIAETHHWMYMTVKSIKQLFVQRSLKGMGGPVMIMKMSVSSAQHSILSLLLFLAIISINLAIFNLLPIGALDGGQILFTTIEAIIRRPLPIAIRIAINLASIILFVGLAIYITFQDITTLFGAKIIALWKKFGW
jgi:regulator of sigma E protease